MSIFVGNLPFRAEQEDVAELFAPFGEVSSCALPLERDSGRKRGFAFVEMADEETEARAIEGLQGAELMGRPLRINKAEPRGSAPRRGGGGYGGGGGGGYGRGDSGGGGGYAADRGSGARGWEDRSYGGGGGAPSGGYGGASDGFEAGRTRRRRSGGGSAETGAADGGHYSGAEG
ncbi:RNA-binding protein [Synechococcus sp. CBW1002]|uniref:RNA recognition motif domain-containing protein n=1 Tax=unclassified Synechococcus TaxID=2626047 RepID=UPI0018CDD751|nr:MULTISPECIES: RNA-binding protein [unclassified Synechococcus]QPN60792.1 RNA-binding protein [Synechococcus sp. CBW1002]QPN67506.1 RNA-binding protein [Synechococcus sp. CBW1006]